MGVKPCEGSTRACIFSKVLYGSTWLKMNETWGLEIILPKPFSQMNSWQFQVNQFRIFPRKTLGRHVHTSADTLCGWSGGRTWCWSKGWMLMSFQDAKGSWLAWWVTSQFSLVLTFFLYFSLFLLVFIFGSIFSFSFVFPLVLVLKGANSCSAHMVNKFLKSSSLWTHDAG